MTDIRPVLARRSDQYRDFRPELPNTPGVTPTRQAPWDEQTLLDAQAMAHVGMWEWSAATGEIRWSPELCRIYGFDPDGFEHDYDRFMATVVDEDRPLIEQAMVTALGHGESFDFELRIVGEDGHARTLHAVGQVRLDPETGRPDRILGTTQDITERKLAEAASSASERMFRAAFDDAPIGLALVGLDGGFLRVNRSLCAMLDRTAEELLGSGFQPITHADDLDADLAAVARLIAGDAESYEIEKRYLRADGEVVWAALSVSLVRDGAGEPHYFVSQIQDISEARRLREHLHHLADHDALTGVRNRRRFDEDLAAQASRAQRYGERAAVILIDLNHFKQVNDRLGHHEGDEVLKRVAATLQRRVRVSDVVARVGGDEFALLLLNISVAEADRMAAEVAQAISREVGHGVTASCGVAMLEADPDDAMRAADRAMYAEKPRAAQPVSLARMVCDGLEPPRSL